MINLMITHLLSYLGLSWIMIAFFWNLINQNLPKIPGDIYIDRAGVRVYIPFVSAIVLSIVLSYLVPLFIPAARN